MDSNYVRKVREAKVLSKTELARHARISPLTLDRIEKRCPPRSLLAANSLGFRTQTFSKAGVCLERLKRLADCTLSSVSKPLKTATLFFGSVYHQTVLELN